MLAIYVDDDPNDGCSHDVDAPIGVGGRGVTIGGLGSDVYVGGAAGPACRIVVESAAEDAVWLESAFGTAAAQRATERRAVGDTFEVRKVRFGVARVDSVARLDHVHTVRDWLVIGALRPDRVGRKIAIHPRTPSVKETFCLVVRDLHDDVDEPRVTRFVEDDKYRCSIVLRLRGVNLLTLLGRAGSSLEPAMAVHLVKRLVREPWLIDVDVAWDGRVVRRPRVADAPPPHEVDRLHNLLTFVLPEPTLDRLPWAKDVLRSALDYNTFDAVIPTAEVESAIKQLRAVVPFEEKDVARVVRGLFPDEWQAEQELLEQLPTLDAAGVRWLIDRRRG